MKVVQFSETALKQLQLYKYGNSKLVFKIFELILDIQKTPFDGIGKPEPLKNVYPVIGQEGLMMNTGLFMQLMILRS